MQEFYSHFRKFCGLATVLFFTFLNSSVSWGQVTITKPSLTVTAYCSFPTDYYPLGDIVITEKNEWDFLLPNKSTGYSVVLTAPANFEFNTTKGTVNINGGDIVSATISNLTTNAITITYYSSNGNFTGRHDEKDILTISGIEVRGTTAASTGSIYRSGGNGSINGLTVSPTTTVASLTSETSTAVPAITTNPANATVAAGGNTSFTVVASNHPTSYTWQVSTNGGSTWSTVTNGGVYSNATTATLNITGATISMDGYQYRVRATNGCGASAYSTAATLTVSLNYCVPSVSAGYGNTNYIKQVNFIGNFVNSNNGPTTGGVTSIGYSNYTGLGSRATQAQGEGINIFLDTDRANALYMKAWVDWNKNGTFDASEIVYECTNPFINTTFGFQVPPATTPGNYRIRLRVNRANSASSNTFGSCFNLVNYGETEDYVFTVIANCAAKITTITPGYHCGPGSVTLGANGTAGTTEYRWYTTATGGTPIGTSTSTSWPTPTISSTTTFYVTAFNGSCESTYRTAVTATIKPIATLSFSNANQTVCGEESTIELSATASPEQIYLVDENFESGTLGAFTEAHYGTINNTLTNWQVKTSTYVPTYPTYPVWYPAISSGFGTNKFALTNSDISTGGTTFGKIDNAIELTNSINTMGFSNLTLDFKMYFSSYYDMNSAAEEFVVAEYKIGTGAWTMIPGGQFLSDVGIGTQFVPQSINISSLINIPDLRIRIRYKAGWNDGVAVDDIRVYGDKPLAPSFTWSGSPVDAYTDATFTTPYVPGTVLTGPVYIKPTLSQLEQTSYSFTANVSLANGCISSATINVTNKSKVWKGTTSNDWNVASNWLPVGIPDATTCVVIPTGTTSQIINTPTALAKNLTVKAPTGNLELQANQNLIVTDWVKVENGGVFNIRNSANLVQLNDTPSPANSGNITMDRTANNLHLFDYVYWSSPVENFAVTNVSPLTPTSKIYHWVTTHNNGTGYGYGNWLNVNENMVAGKGYIVRVPNGNTSFSTTFTGKPLNGVITKGVARGPYNTGVDYSGTNGWITTHDDNWNLVGNPYPSAIDAIEFLAANSGIIEGEVNLWTHSSAISTANPSPYYQTFGYNYKSNDYVTYNASGNNIGATIGFNGRIAAGQGFFVKMIDGGVGTANLTFNNSMRTDGSNNAYNNGQFYRTSDQQTATTEPEKHRIWLDLIDSNMNTSRFMAGYIQGATNDKDHLYDARTNYTESLKAFTMVDQSDDIFVIQGKSLPFDSSDKINFGIQVPANATYKIAIADVDGLFKTEGQKIYVEDLLTNTTHDLTLSPYSFTSDKGIFKNRFMLKFNDQKLSNTENEFNNSVRVFGKEQLVVKSELFAIKDVTVYDVLGKTLLDVKDIAAKEYQANAVRATNTVLLVKATLENGAVVTKKVIF